MKKKGVEISARMKALTGLVTPGLVVCDIGCDHGFVSIYLVQHEISPKVFAMDVRSGPLSQARAHIVQYGLEAQIETRLSDGLKELTVGEAEGMICAGMGGPLMIKILEEGRDQALAMQELILQPQSEIQEFRRYLRTHGYHILKEDMVFEDGKYYPMMKAVPGGRGEDSECYGEDFSGRTVPGSGGMQLFDRFGRYLLEQKHPVLRQYLEFSEQMTAELIRKLRAQQGEKALKRLPEVEEELALILKALERMKGDRVC